MKILHVEAGRNLYGGALQVLYLLRGLGARGVESTLVCPSGSEIGRQASEEGLRVKQIQMRGDLDLFLVGRLRKIIREEKPDLIHLHSRRGADLLGGLAARREKIPAIVTRRVDNPEPALWARLKYHLFCKVVTISHAIGDVLKSEGVPESKIVCVHSGVDTETFRPDGDREWLKRQFGISPNAVALGMIAQFIERKGHRVFIEAVAAVADDFPDIRILLLGQGPLREEMERLVASLDLERIFRFAGFRSDLEKILPCLDLVVHPALMEGLGVALLQTAASGVPIIGANAGGIPEIVRDGENGLLVPAGDYAYLAVTLRDLLNDPGRMKTMGVAGRGIVQREFSLDAMVEGNVLVYREVLGLP